MTFSTNKMNCKDLNASLGKLVSYYESIRHLANSHVGSVFTENLWSQLVPENIQNELGSPKSINFFIELYPDIMKGNCPPDFAESHPKLLSFLLKAADHSLIHKKSLFQSLKNLETVFSNNQFSYDSNFKLTGFMRVKKLHEVQVTSKVAANLTNFTKTSHIVDVGSGKGYLSSIMALNYSYKVLSLDASQLVSCNAVKRSEQIARTWSDGVFSSANIHFDKAKKEEFIKNHNKMVTTHVTPDTDLKSIVKESFEEEINGITMTGLHTCGNLSPTCLRLFVNDNDIRSLVNVGCCYHLLEETIIESNHHNEKNGFPMSKFLKERNFTLGRNARALALQSLDRICLSENEFSLKSLFYRAVLATFIKANKGNVPSEKKVGRLAKRCRSFHEYMERALKILNLELEISESAANDLYNSFIDQKPKLTAFFLLRVSLAPVIESIILLDRYLFLLESGIDHAYIVQLFDLETSPRGFGVVAWKEAVKS